MANDEQGRNADANFKRHDKSSKKGNWVASRQRYRPPSSWGMNMFCRDDEEPELNTSQPCQNRTTEEYIKQEEKTTVPEEDQPAHGLSQIDSDPFELKRKPILKKEGDNSILESKDKEISKLKRLLNQREKELHQKNKQNKLLEENLQGMMSKEVECISILQSKDKEIFKLRKLLRNSDAKSLKKTQQLREYQQKAQTNFRPQSHKGEMNTLTFSVGEFQQILHAQNRKLVAERDALLYEIEQRNNWIEHQYQYCRQQQAKANKIIYDKNFDLRRKDLLINEHLLKITKIGNALKKMEKDLKSQTDQCTQLVKEKADALKVVEALEEAHCHEESKYQQQLNLLQASLDRAVKKPNAQDLQIEKEQSENTKTISNLAHTQRVSADAQANGGQQEDSLFTSPHTSKDKKEEKKTTKLKALWKKTKCWLKR